MTCRRTALVQEGLAEFDRLWVRGVKLVPGNRHPWFVFSIEGRTLRVPCSCSPSDRYAGNSLRRRIRKTVFKAREDAKVARRTAQLAGQGAKGATGQRTKVRELVKA